MPPTILTSSYYDASGYQEAGSRYTWIKACNSDGSDISGESFALLPVVMKAKITDDVPSKDVYAADKKLLTQVEDNQKLSFELELGQANKETIDLILTTMRTHKYFAILFPQGINGTDSGSGNSLMQLWYIPLAKATTKFEISIPDGMTPSITFAPLVITTAKTITDADLPTDMDDLLLLDGTAWAALSFTCPAGGYYNIQTCKMTS